MLIHRIQADFSICKVADYSEVHFDDSFFFMSKTDEENSLVCMTRSKPKNIIECDDGWKAFRIEGTLDFSLIGILSRISVILAESKIGIFAVSTYNTDYILVKEDRFDQALDALRAAGYEIQ